MITVPVLHELGQLEVSNPTSLAVILFSVKRGYIEYHLCCIDQFDFYFPCDDLVLASNVEVGPILYQPKEERILYCVP